MRYLTDKLLILILCLTMLIQQPINVVLITSLLLAVAISSLCYYLEKSPYPVILISLFCLSSIFIPEIIIFLPVLIYDIANRKKTVPILIAVISLLFAFENSSFFIFCNIITFSMAAVLLGIRTGKQSLLEKKLKELRDTSTELNLLLENKNRDLIERQDSEIYMATLQERNRIAREIHDNVGHMITRSILQIGALKTVNKDPVIDKNLFELNNTLNQAMTSIRNSVHDLHDESIDLHTAINELIDKTLSQNITLDYDIGSIVPKNIKFGFLAIIKEALNNISKHSNATKVAIIVREHPAFFQLLIEDNGTQISNDLKNGMGLTTMKERVNALKGSIKITTDKGFKIFISIMKEV